MLKVISVREEKGYLKQAIAFLQESWSEVSPIIYEDCITHAVHAENPLPQWYLLLKDDEIIPDKLKKRIVGENQKSIERFSL